MSGTLPRERDLPNVALFKMNLRATRIHRAITRGRPGKDIPINVISLVAGKNVAASNPLYYLQAVRSGARDSGTGLFRCEAEYKQVEKHAAELLSCGLTADSFDSIVAAPTTRRQLQDPFLDAIRLRLPKAVDLSVNLSIVDNEIKSDSHHSMEERVTNLRWSEGTDWIPIRRILIVDDVISRGRTAVPLIHSIRDQCSAARNYEITICAPLWIMRDDGDSWLVPASN